MEPMPRIMVVDDEQGICQNVVKILSKNNYDVSCALSAKEALDKMSEESYSLVISDLVMPEMNGLELLKKVKKDYPEMKSLMMTAYASTDTAMKAIRLGALDYLPKPFTPDELRSTVSHALKGDLPKVQAPAEEVETIDVIDFDMPFEAEEVAKYTGEEYVKSLGPSDMPVVEAKPIETLEHYCKTGDMVCEIFKKLGATCKAGVKTSACPQKKKKQSSGKTRKTDTSQLIGVDMPFNYDEVISVTGPEYVTNLHHEGLSFVPYETLKKTVAGLKLKNGGMIDVDMPFDRNEVEKATGKEYVETLGRSDTPVVEVKMEQPVENYCLLGEMVCDIFKKLGNTCKAGVKSNLCPQKKKAKKVSGDVAPKQDIKKLIGIDMPFEFEEVAQAAGVEYAMNLQPDGTSMIPYEQLKKNVAALLEKSEKADRIKQIDADLSNTVLIIDDEVAVNNNMRKILAKKGYKIDQASDKNQAIEKISSGHYGLVLLDLRIPGVEGLELLKAVRTNQPDARVIIVTGYASIETAVEAARFGAVDYIAKPFTPAELRTATEKALRIAA
ncbi:MAG: response regulator [Proteobacteria bacterium]|nr:response regulator [Pseudomonadota bacterium]